MKSKKALFAALDQFHGTDAFSRRGLKAIGINDETFGRKSCIYINAGSPEARRELTKFLLQQGFAVDPRYDPKGSRIEVQVSYFKGWHWDE